MLIPLVWQQTASNWIASFWNKTNQQHEEDNHQSCMLSTVLSTCRLNKSLNRICTGAMSRSITPLPSERNTFGGGGRWRWEWAHAKCYCSCFLNEASILNVTFLPPRAFCWCNPLYVVALCFKHPSHPSHHHHHHHRHYAVRVLRPCPSLLYFET